MIDFHIRFRTPAFFEKLAAQSPSGFSIEEAFARLADAPQPPASTPDAQLSEWLTALETHGVSHAVVLASCDEDLPVLAEVAQKAEGRLIPLAPFDASSDDAAERAEHLLGATGFRGLILDPARDGYLVSDERLTELFEVLESHAGLVFLRAGIPDLSMHLAFGLPVRFDPAAANPLHLLVPAQRHPNLQFVVPNFGGGYFRELLLLGAECPNVCVESSGSYSWMKAQGSTLGLVDVFERSLAVFGPDRVLFGSASDDPRSGWNHKALTAQREALGACGVTLEQREQLLGGNARRLLRLPVPRRRAVTHPT